MSRDNDQMGSRSVRGLRMRAAAIGIVAVAVIGVGLYALHEHRQRSALLRADPDRLLADPSLTGFADSRGRSAYARHCASCHGADLAGIVARGSPNLKDSVWEYGFGELSDIENTILYGIRSGHPKSHNIADMPAFGRIGQLNDAEIKDVVEYVYSLSHRDADATAARRGYALFMDKGSCYDCHGADASGNIDYGAPDLTGKGWLYGGSRAVLYDSVYNGRHGLCPAWIGKLSYADIRALAVFIYDRSHRPEASR